MNDRIFGLVLIALLTLVFYGCGSTPVEPERENIQTGPVEQVEESDPDAEEEPEAESPPEANIIFVRQRSILIMTEKNVLVFDPVEFKTRSLSRKTFINGFVDVNEIRNSKVTVFITSSAYDRFYPAIWDWKENVKDLNFVVEKRVPGRDSRFAGESVFMMKAGETAEIGDIKVTAIGGTAESVSFYVDCNGLKIYYSGDFNAPQGDAQAGIGEESKLDIVIHAFNRRGGKSGCAGALKITKDFSAKLVIPLEPGGRISTVSVFTEELKKALPDTPVWQYRKMGESIKYPEYILPQEEPK
ncbi:MAG: MBL fold metallo-hydrolase [Planctomycetota bacterium]|jgi:L-ascorbate metabolism protein UlaG (beta-lactamase superfamily)